MGFGVHQKVVCALLEAASESEVSADALLAIDMQVPSVVHAETGSVVAIGQS